MTVTNYIWDDDNLLMETDGADAVQAVYTVEPDVYGNVISQHRGGNTSYLHHDALGSTRTVTDSAGAITDTFTYTAWGEEVERTGTTVVPFRWVGQLGYYRDLESASYWVRTRAFHPGIARWKSIDPLGFLAGINRFEYAYNRPIFAVDPSGLLCNPSGLSVFESSALRFVPVQAPIFDPAFGEFWFKAACVVRLFASADCCNDNETPQCRFDQKYKVVRFVENGVEQRTITLGDRPIEIGTQYPDVLPNGGDFNSAGRRCEPCCLGNQGPGVPCASKTWIYWSYDVPGFHNADFVIACNGNCAEPKLTGSAGLVFPGSPGDNRRVPAGGRATFGYSALIVINFETKFTCTDSPVERVAEWGVAVSYSFPSNAQGTGAANCKVSRFS